MFSRFILSLVKGAFYFKTLFTTITKQVLRLILIVGNDVCVRMVFVWQETGVPEGIPPV